MYSFLLVFFSNFVPKMHHFWDILLVVVTIGLSRTVSEINVDFRRKSHKKTPTFPTLCVFNAPAEGVPLEMVSAWGKKKLEWWGYQMVKKVLR